MVPSQPAAQRHTATHSLQHAATHCNTLQHAATHCNTLQQGLPLPCYLSHSGSAAENCAMTQLARCNTLQLAATRCNTLQHAAIHSNTRQHTATHCNTLQHTATGSATTTLPESRWQRCRGLRHDSTCTTHGNRGPCAQNTSALSIRIPPFALSYFRCSFLFYLNLSLCHDFIGSIHENREPCTQHTKIFFRFEFLQLHCLILGALIYSSKYFAAL